jgi:hypothetical protein
MSGPGGDSYPGQCKRSAELAVEVFLHADEAVETGHCLIGPRIAFVARPARQTLAQSKPEPDSRSIDADLR